MQADDPTGDADNSAVDVAQGLIAGWMADQVDDRGKGAQRTGLIVAVVGLALAILVSGWWRGVGLFALFLGLAFFAAVWLARKAALYAITRFAAPRSLADSQDEIRGAIEEMDLPTSPLAIVRFLGRLRKGPGPEVDRVKSVVSRLENDLKAD